MASYVSSQILVVTLIFSQPKVDIMVFGALAVDLSCDYSPGPKVTEVAHSPVLHTSNPAIISTNLGGVGHNVALAAQRAGGDKLNVRLCSYVADDM
jgi:pseudouridine-5'-phosphate glycosidase/pseudouridine kinase